jgi:hypothetical protein
MSKDESLDPASQAGWFLHLGPVRCGTYRDGGLILLAGIHNVR